MVVCVTAKVSPCRTIEKNDMLLTNLKRRNLDKAVALAKRHRTWGISNSAMAFKS